MAAPVRVYTTTTCPHCLRAKRLLDKRGIAYEEVDVTGDEEKRRWLLETTGRRTVPQVFIGDAAVGGADDLFALDAQGDLLRRVKL